MSVKADSCMSYNNNSGTIKIQAGGQM